MAEEAGRQGYQRRETGRREASLEIIN